MNYIDCYNQDEAERIRKVLTQDRNRLYYRDKLLDVIDASLGDGYERKLWKAPKVKSSMNIGKIIKSWLP